MLCTQNYMKIGIYHEPIFSAGDRFETYGAFARYIAEFSRHFEGVTVFAPTTDRQTYFSGCVLNAPNIKVVPLPFFMTHMQAMKHAPSIITAFRRHCHDLDVINARATAPLAYVLWLLTRSRGVPFVYHFASDPFEVLRNSPKYRGWRGRFARAAYGLEFEIQKRVLRHNYGFASGQPLADRLRKHTPNVAGVVTSSLIADDYAQRDDTCIGPVIRLLFVGCLRREKGVDDLIRAVRIMRDGGNRIELDVVGDGDYRGNLEQMARSLDLSAHIRFHGFVVMGPVLNHFYDNADIFVLPSLSEGSPKVVLEAMAHSLPVVATPVGNVPAMLENGRRGVLTPMQDPGALAEGILRLVSDEEFRRDCIGRGYAYARTNGVEAFVAVMAAKMKEMVAQRKGLRVGSLDSKPV
jgi:glycosyltransferase involved in cell wall biosynthesis